MAAEHMGTAHALLPPACGADAEAGVLLEEGTPDPLLFQGHAGATIVAV